MSSDSNRFSFSLGDFFNYELTLKCLLRRRKIENIFVNYTKWKSHFISRLQKEVLKKKTCDFELRVKGSTKELNKSYSCTDTTLGVLHQFQN